MCCICNGVVLQVAAWVVFKEAATRDDLILPLGLFAAHLALGNMWNSEISPLEYPYSCIQAPLRLWYSEACGTMIPEGETFSNVILCGAETEPQTLSLRPQACRFCTNTDTLFVSLDTLLMSVSAGLSSS